jgi:hypothetical protein
LKDVIKLTENRKCWKEIVANFNRRVTWIPFLEYGLQNIRMKCYTC